MNSIVLTTSSSYQYFTTAALFNTTTSSDTPQTHHKSAGDGNTRERISYKFFDKQNQASRSRIP